MTSFWTVAFTMLIWGNLSFAKLPDATNNIEQNDLQTISSWMAHLNKYYPDLNVTPAQKIINSAQQKELLGELRLLEDLLHGEINLPKGSLKQLACEKAVCGGGQETHCGPPRC